MAGWEHVHKWRGWRWLRDCGWWLPLFFLLVASWSLPLRYLAHQVQLIRPAHSQFDLVIHEAAARHGVSPLLVKAMIRQESNFQPFQVGKAGEIGLMQITPLAVRDWEQATGRTCPYAGAVFNVPLNIDIGTWYVARGLKRWSDYRDNVVLALAEYNAGPSRARQWAPDDPRENALDRVRFPSTKGYIVSIMQFRERFEQDAYRRGQRH